MRWLLLLGLVCLPVLASAKPKVAVAPLDGDSDNKVAEVVAEVASEEANVTGPEQTQKAIERLGLGELDGKAIKKLRKRLEVDVLIHGKVEKDGSKKTVELDVSVRGKKTERFTLRFKSSSSESFKRELRDELGKRMSTGEGSDDDDEDKPRKLNDPDEDRPRKKPPDEDEDRPHKKKKKKRRGGDDDEGIVRHAVTLAAVRVDAGVAVTKRTLTYDSTSPTPPRAIDTTSGSGRVAGEVYPGAFDTLEGIGAALGVVFEADKTLGLGLNVPGTTAKAPVDKLHFGIGARYRLAFGQTSVAFGASYYRRRYLVDKSGLAAGSLADVPDVEYSAIAPGAVARFAGGPKLGVFVGLELPLMLSAGPIQKSASYGPANILAIEADAGIEYLVTEHYALRAAFEVSNIGLSFGGKAGTQAATRMVSKATDRNLGLAVTFEVLY